MEKESETEKLEQGVLGAIIICGNQAYNTAVGCGLHEECFQNHANKLMWIAMCELSDEGIEIDLLSIQAKMNNKTMTMLAVQYTSVVANDRHLKSHSALLVGAYVERKANETAIRILGCCNEKEKRGLLSEFDSIMNDYKQAANVRRARSIADILNDAASDLEKRKELYYSGKLAGITTGLTRLNELTNGWQNGSLNVIAARPAMGKTAMAVHFALSAALTGKSVSMYAMEMKSTRVADRMMLALTDLDADDFRKGAVTQHDMKKFQTAGQKLAQLPIYIDDNSYCTTSYIHANSKRLKEDGHCDLIIVDYLQLTDMNSGANRNYNRENQVTKASRDFKNIAKDLDVPVLLLSQLNRAVETRADKKPMLSDLRESGSIEQDADCVMFIHRPEYYGADDCKRYDSEGNFAYGVGELIIAKQREGGIGTIHFNYDRTLTKIRDNNEIM